jgi:hypothetical protein
VRDSFRTIGENDCSPILFAEDVEILISGIDTKRTANEMILIFHVPQIVSFFFRFSFILMFVDFLLNNSNLREIRGISKDKKIGEKKEFNSCVALGV